MISQATRIDLKYRAEYNFARNCQRVKISPKYTSITRDKI